ncbi:leucine-rich repeat domain-containing protein [Streptomyces sp. SAS_270]|uniref:leucine-rich repeat domain-containing protein n=1 Tax=Streptomyces sp. SAS_270 TaxID=3412748 RepID=UPI00403C23B3
MAARIAAARESGNLDLSEMGLTSLPEEVCELTRLRMLDVSRNRLTTLPRRIGELTSLTGLLLSDNPISTLPHSVRNLTSLRTLYLRQCNLRTLPVAVRGLASLTSLDLSQNDLTELPWWIGDLDALTSVNLDFNKIAELPESFGGLSRLQGIDLGNNRLTSLPDSMRRFFRLRNLYLRANQLTELPDWLGDLTALTTLVVDANELRDLPDSLGSLIGLASLRLDANPLTALPPEVVSAGTGTLLAFLRERARAPVPQWSSKIVVVGEGRSGKTSLLKAVRGDRFDPQESSTHGLHVDTLELPHPDPAHAHVTMNLATWDFGGQEIYHATHQFFLTDRSLFVLVWDAQLGWEASKLYYWLDMIKARAPRAPVVLVATHLGPRPAELPLAELQSAYPGMIVDSLTADSCTGEGIDKVVECLALRASRLPLMGVRWPGTWLRASEAVRADRRNHVTPAELDDLLAAYGVRDPDHQRGLRAALNSLGDILAYADDPELEDIAVLRPQWVTGYISRVLDSRGVRQNRALFTRQHQAQLWRDLDPSLRQHFVAMMERFDLSYRTDVGAHSLVVELLPLDPPAYEAEWAAAALRHHRELRLRYRMHTVPPGIPTWFIAREHRFTQGLHWRTGALLRQSTEDGEHTALITVDRLTKTAELQVRGPYPQDFFAVLKDGFEQTLQRYPGLEITRLVPCPGRLAGGAGCTHEFPHAQLKDRLTRTPPRDTVECPVDYDDHDVRLLLQGIESPSADRSVELARETREAVRRLQVMVQEQGQDQAVRQTDLLEELQLAKAQRTAIAAEQQRVALATWRGDRTAQEVSCPTLLSVTRVERRRALRLTPVRVLQLRLYCEAPGAWHPAPGHEPYEVRATSERVAELLPYARTVLKVLRFAVPVAGAVLDVAAEELNKQLKDDIKLMQVLVDAVPGEELPELDGLRSLTRAEFDSDFRAMHALLESLDPERRWGDLNKVVTPEGDTLWLCAQHARPYLPAGPAGLTAPGGTPALPSPRADGEPQPAAP